MNKYRVVGGTAKFGPGQSFVLSPDQIRRRRHNLDVPAGYEGKGECAVKALRAVEFKRGEVIALPSLEKRLVDALIPVGPPKSEVEEIALRKDTERATEAAAQKAAAAKAKAGAKPQRGR